MGVLTFKQIKEKVGNAWALIYNPVYSEKTGKLVKGELVSYNKDDNKLLGMVSEDKNPKKHFTVIWFGEDPKDNILLNFF